MSHRKFLATVHLEESLGAIEHLKGLLRREKDSPQRGVLWVIERATVRALHALDPDRDPADLDRLHGGPVQRLPFCIASDDESA